MKKVLFIKIIILVSLGLFLFYPFGSNENKTKQFIDNHFINDNGTIATYVKPGEAFVDEEWAPLGREAISESLGLMLEYNLIKNEQTQFMSNVTVLENYFLKEDGFIYWRLNADGDKLSEANSLVDDLRIMRVLYKASEQFKEEKYRQLARKIQDYIITNQINNGYLVDFYDRAYSLPGGEIHLSYIDTEALKYFAKEIFEKQTQLLLKHDNIIFFPERFDVIQKQFSWDKEVNLIDQTIIAQNVTNAGVNTELYVDFIRQSFKKDKKIFGKYDRKSLQPTVNFESSAVYALLIMLVSDYDKHLAMELYERLKLLEDKEEGGFKVFDNAHFFDNILPLIAKEKVK